MEVQMYKLKFILLLSIFLSSISLTQNTQQSYKLLFKSDCSISDAMDVLYNTYSSIVGDKRVYDLKIEKYNFNFGKITLLLDNEPNSDQIHELYENKNLVSFELINNKLRNEEFNEFMERYKKKTKRYLRIPQVPDYELILKYKFNSKPEDENWFLFKLFGRRGSYEKDANNLVISIPERESESFIKKLKINNKIVYIQKL
jgi:hypothetical protein